MTTFLTLLAGHAMTGYLLAVGVDGFLWGDSRWAAARGVVGWLALGAGARGLHGAFSPAAAPAPAGPRPVLEMSAATMVGALLLSFTLPPGYRMAVALCFLFSVLVALPPVRLADRRGWDPAVTALAFGFLTPYAGVAATGASLDLVSGLALLGFAPLAAAGRTLMATAGADPTPRLAIWGAAAAFACWVVAWLVRGDPWHVPGGPLPGLVALAIAFAAWSRVFLRDRVRGRWGPPQLAAAWVLTDGAIVVAFAW